MTDRQTHTQARTHARTHTHTQMYKIRLSNDSVTLKAQGQSSKVETGIFPYLFENIGFSICFKAFVSISSLSHCNNLSVVLSMHYFCTYLDW